MYKRKPKSVIITLFLIINLLFSGCQSNVGQREVFVEMIDAGAGNCIFISLPENQYMLIDTGINTLSVREKIIDNVKKHTSTIDYLIISNPASTNIGNAEEILNNFTVKNLYIPLITNRNVSSAYNTLMDMLETSDTLVKNPYIFDKITNTEFKLLFLTPLNVNNPNSSLYKLNNTEYPTEELIYNVSPIMYFECRNTRFIFTGDAGLLEESIVTDNYYANIYEQSFVGENSLSLSDVDFLKISRHGGKGATGTEFLSLLRPKNVLISVDGINNKFNPDDKVLERICSANNEVKIFRTDVVGSVKIKLNVNASYEIITEKDYD